MRESAVMNHMQKELRRAAARAFMESLEQLETRLSSEDVLNAPVSRTEMATPDAPQFTVGDFEAAMADIDQHTRRL